MKKFHNRYKDIYYFEPVEGKTFKFVMEGDSMQWCRYGARESHTEIDTGDLGFFDPSGGPYIAVGDRVYGVSSDTSIDTIKRIWVADGSIMLEIK